MKLRLDQRRERGCRRGQIGILQLMIEFAPSGHFLRGGLEPPLDRFLLLPSASKSLLQIRERRWINEHGQMVFRIGGPNLTCPLNVDDENHAFPRGSKRVNLTSRCPIV